MLLRAILTVVLLLGSGAGDWSQLQGQTHESCCCGMAAEAGDSCPCPKPENSRAPRGACADRQQVATAQAPRRSAQGQRRGEARPEPATWAGAEAPASFGRVTQRWGRAPDLGRHLAAMGALRI